MPLTPANAPPAPLLTPGCGNLSSGARGATLFFYNRFLHIGFMKRFWCTFFTDWLKRNDMITSFAILKFKTCTKQTFAINLLQEKMSFTGETSTSEKDAKYRSETKEYSIFSYNDYFVFQKIGNSQNILRKINFHTKTSKQGLPV